MEQPKTLMYHRIEGRYVHIETCTKEKGRISTNGTAKDSDVPYKRGRILANETAKLKQGMAGLCAAVSYMYVHTIDLFSQKQTTLVFVSTYVIHSI